MSQAYRVNCSKARFGTDHEERECQNGVLLLLVEYFHRELQLPLDNNSVEQFCSLLKILGMINIFAA